jgi:hypothetical protein
MLKIYWQYKRKGQELVIDALNGQTATLGAVRETKRGFDAFATATGYDPGRATKGLPTMEEAKAFVESFEPWSLYEGGMEALPIEAEVRARETA